MSNDDRRLFCLIEGDGRVFEVTVNINRSISHLKNIIHKSGEKGALSDIGAKDLTLLKVNRDLNCEDSLSRLDGEKLLAWNLVGKYWLKQPDAGRLHVLVKLPNTTDLVRQVSGAGPPPHSDTWCPRTETIKDLYEALLQEKLVYVRGTPACGKTTLMLLLVAYIKRIEPSAFVYRFSSWKHESSSESVIQGINHLYSKQGGLAFLFFDDAQDTYGDEYLWSQFFKNVADGIGHYYVVVFCSYGSPTARPVDTKYGIPPVLRSAALITLWPKKQANGRETNGLFLDRQEFNNVIERHSSNNLSKIHSDLSQLIFDWTNGHVGAVVELLNLISNGMKSRMRRGEVITVETFHEEFPVHVILLGLYGGAFGRGLPAADDVGNADLAAVFRRLLADGTIPAQQNNDSAVLTCHRRGWIYAKEERSIDGVSLLYSFSTPLHAATVSWMLIPTNDMPAFQSLYELSIKVISRFKPSQFTLPNRRVGAGFCERPPEALYQDEFYRCLLAVTCGNVRISPEFATTQQARKAGRIDFFIPSVKWGIELTRDGNHLNEHALRFGSRSAYGKWKEQGDMDEYILLDCHAANVRDPHPNIPFLYHIVFQQDYQKVCVYDHKVTKVEEMCLQE